MLMRLHQTGDTIVEVLVVLAVLGLAIGISYATANRSLLAIRGAHEVSEATTLLQSQTELLRAYSNVKDNTSLHYIYQTASTFCFYKQAVVAPVTTNCSQDSQGLSSADSVTDARYAITVQYNNSASDLFTLVVTWDDVQGQGQDSATLVYRVHP